MRGRPARRVGAAATLLGSCRLPGSVLPYRPEQSGMRRLQVGVTEQRGRAAGKTAAELLRSPRLDVAVIYPQRGQDKGRILGL